MARSDRHDVASDALVREVARQLAEAAPPAPAWEDIHRGRTRADLPAHRPAWATLALVAATVAFVVSGLWWLAGSSPEPNEPVDVPEPAPITTVVASVGEQLPFADLGVGPGRYDTFVLGMDATFDVPVEAVVFANTAGRIIISDHPGIQLDDLGGRVAMPPEARIVGFTRLSGWYTKTEGTSTDQSVTPSISPDDPEAWIAANDVVATPRRTIDVAGRTTTTWDAVVDPDSDIDFDYKWCLPENNPCFLAGAIARRELQPTRNLEPTLAAGTVNRFWLITIQGSEPLLVQATAPTGDEAWLDLVGATTIANLELGPDAPPLD